MEMPASCISFLKCSGWSEGNACFPGSNLFVDSRTVPTPLSGNNVWGYNVTRRSRKRKMPVQRFRNQQKGKSKIRNDVITRFIFKKQCQTVVTSSSKSRAENLNAIIWKFISQKHFNLHFKLAALQLVVFSLPLAPAVKLRSLGGSLLVLGSASQWRPSSVAWIRVTRAVVSSAPSFWWTFKFKAIQSSSHHGTSSHLPIQSSSSSSSGALPGLAPAGRAPAVLYLPCRVPLLSRALRQLAY